MWKSILKSIPNYYIGDDDWMDLMPSDFNIEAYKNKQYEEKYEANYPLMVVPDEKFANKALRSRYDFNMQDETRELFTNMKDIEPVVVMELLNEDGSVFDRILVAGHLRSHLRGLAGHKTIPTIVLTMKEKQWRG